MKVALSDINETCIQKVTETRTIQNREATTDAKKTTVIRARLQ